jgi:hypothetical protein
VLKKHTLAQVFQIWGGEQKIANDAVVMLDGDQGSDLFPKFS